MPTQSIRRIKLFFIFCVKHIVFASSDLVEVFIVFACNIIVILKIFCIHFNSRSKEIKKIKYFKGKTYNLIYIYMKDGRKKKCILFIFVWTQKSLKINKYIYIYIYI